VSISEDMALTLTRFVIRLSISEGADESHEDVYRLTTRVLLEVKWLPCILTKEADHIMAFAQDCLLRGEIGLMSGFKVSIAISPGTSLLPSTRLDVTLRVSAPRHFFHLQTWV